ncbi:hypothetical protein ACWGIV_25855 [Streptomyces sp. NPDC054844]
MPFRNSILAGTTLVREAIESQNYDTGVSGWIIRADGTAEFADLVIRSSDGSGASVEIENGRAVFTAANGWQIIIDPTNVLPIIYFTDASGDEMGAINASGTEDVASLITSSGPFADGPVTDWRWVQRMGETNAGSRVSISRLRDEDESVMLGGWLFLDPDVAQFGVIDSADSANNTIFQAGSHVFVMDQGRVVIGAPASANPGIWLQVDGGHTGALLELDEGGVTKLRVTEAGDVAAAGSVTADNMRAGTAQCPAPGGAPGQTSVNVVFANPMPSTARVVCTPDSTAGNLDSTNIRWATTGESATGFTINCWRDTNAATNFNWIALTDTE